MYSLNENNYIVKISFKYGATKRTSRDARCLCSYCEILNTQGLCYIIIVKFEKKILATKNKTRQAPFSMSKN